MSSVSVPAAVTKGRRRVRTGVVVRLVIAAMLVGLIIADGAAIHARMTAGEVGHYTVFLRAGSDVAGIAASEAKSKGFEVERVVQNGNELAFVASIREDRASALLANSDIAYIEKDNTVQVRTSWWDSFLNQVESKIPHFN